MNTVSISDQSNTNKKLWIVGQVSPLNNSGKDDMQTNWEFQGVFDSEEKAIAACKSPLFFIGPAILNEELPETLAEWLGAYFPLIPKVFQ